MPKSEREETLNALTARVFQAMLEELVMDATLQSHQEVARSRTVCKLCKTRCGSVHTPANAASAAAAAVAASRAGTPSSAASAEVPLARSGGQTNGTGASTPTSQGQRGADGTLLLDCVSCARQVASNRYAPHLSSCMGLNNTRRGAPRATANTKTKPPSDTGRSASPLSDLGHVSDDAKVAKGKAKAKKGGDEDGFSLKRKRPGSPQISPNKKSKKNKPSGSPVSRVKADPDSSGLPSTSHFSPSANTSHSKIPSKLRASSTSFLDRDDSSDDSHSSEPEPEPPARSRASYGAAPNGKSAGGGGGAGGPSRPGNGPPRPQAMGTGPPKRPTPPRPPPVHVPGFEYEVDHANETGSSTDTDSD